MQTESSSTSASSLYVRQSSGLVREASVLDAIIFNAVFSAPVGATLAFGILYALGLFTGAGVPPQACQNYIGIIKAYSTRVGGGPFPTEQNNDIGNYIRERGNEYGTTTRRPRRCGWFDAVAVRYSVDLCGVTQIAMTLLDVLAGLEHLRICTGYKHRGQRLDAFRADMDVLAEVESVYETLPGFNGNISACRRFEELPMPAQQYVKRIEQLCGVPIKMVSVGPERSATLMR